LEAGAAAAAAGGMMFGITRAYGVVRRNDAAAAAADAADAADAATMFADAVALLTDAEAGAGKDAEVKEDCTRARLKGESASGEPTDDDTSDAESDGYAAEASLIMFDDAGSEEATEFEGCCSFANSLAHTSIPSDTHAGHSGSHCGASSTFAQPDSATGLPSRPALLEADMLLSCLAWVPR
jgi:hypothetical protein